MGLSACLRRSGTVGGLADWFAVTALFRRPLGLPIRTAIIPENKDRIAVTMAGFPRIFLTPAVVGRRMGSMNLHRRWEVISPTRGQRRTAHPCGAGELAVEVLELLDPERLGTQVRQLKTQLAKLEVAPLLGGMLEAMIADGRHRPLIDKIIRWAGLVLEDNETLVRDMVHKRANAVLRFTGLDERLANSVLDGLYKLLAEVLVDPDHPLRSKIEEGLQDLAHGLREDPEMRERIERMKQELLENPAIGDWWQGVWERLRANLIESIRSSNGSTGHDYIGETLGELGAALRDDERLQRQVNRFARRTAVGVATRYGDQIVRLVSETVKRWDAQTITDRVESAVGRDLQFIRINGTLVGGLVGMTIHTLDIYVI